MSTFHCTVCLYYKYVTHSTSSDPVQSEEDSLEEVFSDDSNKFAGDLDDENVPNLCLPLFFYNSLSVCKFNALLLALKQRDNISNLALDSILKILHMCLPDGSKLPKSSYLFEQEN